MLLYLLVKKAIHLCGIDKTKGSGLWVGNRDEATMSVSYLGTNGGQRVLLAPAVSPAPVIQSDHSAKVADFRVTGSAPSQLGGRLEL